MAYDEDTAGRVRRLLSHLPDVTEQQMMGGLCFMVEDRMCCSVSGKGGLLVRVGAEAQQSMLGEPHVMPMKMGRRVMSGFVRVAPEGYLTEAALKTWLERALDVVATMPQKPTRRKAPTLRLVKPRDRTP